MNNNKQNYFNKIIFKIILFSMGIMTGIVILDTILFKLDMFGTIYVLEIFIDRVLYVFYATIGLKNYFAKTIYKPIALSK